MKKALFLFLVLILCFSTVYAASGERIITDDYVYYYSADLDGYVVYCLNKELTEATIQSKVEGKDVVAIGDYAFKGFSKIESISLPNTIKEIGEYAFYNCYGLTSINIPDDVTKIGDYAFSGCYDLTSITIPNGVTQIGNYTFYNCRELTSISIPDGVTAIGDSAFRKCDSLTSISIPEGVTTIGECAFCDCSSLTSITIPSSVTKIGRDALYTSSKKFLCLYESTTENWGIINISSSPYTTILCTDGIVRE